MGELKQGSNPHIRAIVWVRGETFKAESETAHLWPPKWKENQTVLAAAIYTLDRNAGPLEGAAAGSWSLGIVVQSQGEGYGKRLAKQAFWSPATRGSKKDSDRDITPVAEAVHVPASQAAGPPSRSTLKG